MKVFGANTKVLQVNTKFLGGMQCTVYAKFLKGAQNVCNDAVFLCANAKVC